jgi:hypothetical protein
MRIVHWIFGACLFTASFDAFLTFDLGGTIRFAQIASLGVLLAAVAIIVQDGRILWPRGGAALALWLLLQGLFVRFSGNLLVGVTFFALLCSMALVVFAVVQIWGLSSRVEDLMRLYLASYWVMALYGLFQFFLPFFTGIAAPGTRQWYVYGRIPRVMGFSFEPSYYATYMVLGWIMLLELRLSGARIAQGRWMKWMTVAATLAMFLCASRVGWLCMLIEVVARAMPAVRRRLARKWLALRHGYLLLRIPTRRNAARGGVVLGILAALVVGAFTFMPNPSIILGGTGLAGTAAHSVDDRLEGTLNTWEAIKASPWVGRSLGGVPVEIANMKGQEVNTIRDVRLYWGFPVLLDMVAASGVFGVIPFLVFLWSTTFGAARYASTRLPDERAKWLRALSRATIFIWIMLFNDQNVLRLYLWFHFAIVMVIRYHLEFAPAPAFAAAPDAPAAPFSLPAEAAAL